MIYRSVFFLVSYCVAVPAVAFADVAPVPGCGCRTSATAGATGGALTLLGIGMVLSVALRRKREL
jgi:MYXO-CTERM domain-containing protein